MSTKVGAVPVYPYFVCIGRHQKRTSCTAPAMPIEQVEVRVADLYRLVTLTPETIEAIEENLRASLREGARESREAETLLSAKRGQLAARSEKLLHAHLDDTISADLYRAEQAKINRDLASTEVRLAALQTEFAVLETNLSDALSLVGNCYEAYVRAPDRLRRLFNQAFFERILVDRDDHVEADLAEPVATIVALSSLKQSTAPPEGDAVLGSGSYKVNCSRQNLLVDPRRFELLTSSMRTRRATNCAKGP